MDFDKLLEAINGSNKGVIDAVGKMSESFTSQIAEIKEKMEPKQEEVLVEPKVDETEPRGQDDSTPTGDLTVLQKQMNDMQARLDAADRKNQILAKRNAISSAFPEVQGINILAQNYDVSGLEVKQDGTLTSASLDAVKGTLEAISTPGTVQFDSKTDFQVAHNAGPGKSEVEAGIAEILNETRREE